MQDGISSFEEEFVRAARKRRKFGCKVNEKQREIKCSTCSFSFLLRFFFRKRKVERVEGYFSRYFPD